MNKLMKYELHNIISRKSKIRNGTIIQTISNYLRECKKKVELLKLKSTSKNKKQRN